MTKHSYASAVIAACLVQFAFILDCADGQLARYKKIYSPIGPWLDIFSDRIREFFLIAGFTIKLGYTNENAWFFGLYSMFLLFLYHGEANTKLPFTGEKEKERARKMERGIIKKAMRLRERLNIGAFYIGEQYLLMSLFLLLNRADLFFYVFTVYGSLVVFTYPFYKYYHYKLHERRK
jgi:phosphatidylglycerophosphate synthase